MLVSSTMNKYQNKQNAIDCTHEANSAANADNCKLSLEEMTRSMQYNGNTNVKHVRDTTTQLSVHSFYSPKNLPTPFRWGYGWPYPRGYKVLSESERQQVENAARNVKLEKYFMSKTKKQ
mgnify:CR=1 FL=1